MKDSQIIRLKKLLNQYVEFLEGRIDEHNEMSKKLEPKERYYHDGKSDAYMESKIKMDCTFFEELKGPG